MRLFAGLGRTDYQDVLRARAGLPRRPRHEMPGHWDAVEIAAEVVEDLRGGDHG